MEILEKMASMRAARSQLFFLMNQLGTIKLRKSLKENDGQYKGMA